ncbi:MAG: polymorphic toxin-type HINT domain-containing protein, partial [Gemmataceae bacterium]
GSGSTLSSSAKDWVFLHQGGERIVAGDYEFRNRVYSPSLGRWLSNDPLGFNAGDQNWYRAIGNNPGNSLDALGLTDAPFKPNDDGSRPDNAGIGGFGVQRPSRPSQYIPSSWDWFEIISNTSAGMGDTVSLGLTKRFRVWVGYDDVVGYDTWAYAGGTAIGTGVNVGLGVVNPCALGGSLGTTVRLINAGQAIGGSINAGENIANGNYWEAGFDLIGVAGNASQVVRPCFAAGTPIRTTSGSILIENLKVGDTVLSRNEFDPNGQVDEKIVEDVFVRSAPILNVVVQGRVIRTTAEHPFWVDGKGWTAAGELKAGDNLLTVDKSKLPVENVSETGDTEIVYNFRVADWHTYFVGNENWNFEVWVHNACGPGGQAPRSTPSLREQYLGRTPGKGSRTGRQVIERIENEGNLRWNSRGGAEVRYVDPVTKAESWHPINSTDMGHLQDAVKYWNETGRTLGPKHSDVRKWMLDPANYELQPSSINRSNGARLKDRYLSPLGDE